MWFIFVAQIYLTLIPNIDDLNSDALDAAIFENGGYLTQDAFNQVLPMDGYIKQSAKILDTAQTCRQLLFSIRVLISINLIILMFRFFKAFRANPRLAVVTNTLVKGGVDIAHFFIVFSVIFVSFSAMGAVLFGSRVELFRSIQRSLNTSFVVLMGDFDFEELEMVNVL